VRYRNNDFLTIIKQGFNFWSLKNDLDKGLNGPG